ncbi:MAG: ATP-binding protein [Actinomycetota bacterium]
MTRPPRAVKDPAGTARRARRESKYVDFKESFDPDQDGEWCELLKDFAAMANSGGGIVVVGLRNNGTLSRLSVTKVLKIDPAHIADKLFKYTSEHFDGFAVREVRRGQRQLAVIVIEGVDVPIVFTKPGTHAVPNGRQKTAFARGTCYFRHGAKSEPATSNDLRLFVERQVENARHVWLGNVRKVVEAPADAHVAVYRPSHGETEDGPQLIQLTNDSNAPVYGRLDPDISHPFRQTDLIPEVNRRLPPGATINTYDVL